MSNSIVFPDKREVVGAHVILRLHCVPVIRRTACNFSRDYNRILIVHLDISRYVRSVTPFSSCPSFGRDSGVTGESPERALVKKPLISGEDTTLYGYINTQRATLPRISQWKINYEVRVECSVCAVEECP